MVVSVLVLMGCLCDKSSSSLITPEILFDSFEKAGSLALRRVRDANLDGCRYHYGGAANYPAASFEGILGDFVIDVYDAHEKKAVLHKIYSALQIFVHDTNSVIELAYPEDAHYLLLEPQLSDWARADPMLILPTDTTLLLVEATQMLLLATQTLAGGVKFCGIGNDIPYVVVSPIRMSDSFSVRVGLRMPEICSSPSNYAIVFGDTLPYLPWAWADGTFHRRQLNGIDTLRVKSCLGNPLTGMYRCREKWVVVGW